MSKKITGIGVLSFLCGGLAVALGGLVLYEPKAPEGSSGGPSNASQVRAVTELRQSVSKLQSDVSKLRKEMLSLAMTKPTAEPKKLTELPPVTSSVDPKNIAAMAARIKALEAALSDVTKPLQARSSADLMAKFNDAMLAKDGKAAVEVMVALTKIDPPDYQAFMHCYAEMREKEWLGVGRFDRRGWGSKELYSWALTSATLGVKDEHAKAFWQEAVIGFRRYERDETKRAEAYAAFINNQPAPPALAQNNAEGEERGRGGRDRGRGRGGRGGFGRGGFGGFGRGGFGRGGSDPYRMALFMVARVKSPVASNTLSTVLINQANPTDVRVTALRGLAEQTDPAAASAIQNATNDSDEEVRKTAELLAAKKNAPVPGVMVTRVSDDSVAAKAGLASGQIITAINGKAVKSTREISRALRGATAENITLTIYSGGSSRTVTIARTRRLGISGEAVAPASPE